MTWCTIPSAHTGQDGAAEKVLSPAVHLGAPWASMGLPCTACVSSPSPFENHTAVETLLKVAFCAGMHQTQRTQEGYGNRSQLLLGEGYKRFWFLLYFAIFSKLLKIPLYYFLNPKKNE